MVIGVFETGLKHIVIDIGDRDLRLDAIKSHCFKLQIGHRAGGILRESLIDANTDFGTDFEFTINEVFF